MDALTYEAVLKLVNKSIANYAYDNFLDLDNNDRNGLSESIVRTLAGAGALEDDLCIEVIRHPRLYRSEDEDEDEGTDDDVNMDDDP